MERLPAEIWELVLENLIDFRDSQNASDTCTLWRNILQPLKSSWLFGQVLPLIFEHLSKSDLLQCRLVSRQWCFGVDHFLENNAYHRPARGKLFNSTLFTTDFPLNSLEKVFRNKKLDYNYSFGNLSNRGKMVSEAAVHSRCPIVGRSLSISESNLPCDQSNSAYLEIFGRHVWFLKICAYMQSVEALERTLKLLSFVPNLKSFRIEGRLLIQSEKRDKELLTKFVQKFADERQSNLPKLEALQIFMISPVLSNYWSGCLVSCISTEKLQSLHLPNIMKLSKFKLENLVDLSINLNSDSELENITLDRSPRVQRLCLELSGQIQSRNVLGLILRLGETLRNFELKLQPGYFSVSNNTSEINSTQYIGFSQRHFFMGYAIDLKRMTLKGIPPPSLNFLLGFSDSLEYLHISLEHLNLGWQQRFIDPVIKSINCKEELDLLEKLKDLSPNQVPVTYQSNIWKRFGKLKVLTVEWCQWDYENRRDIYDKYMNRKLNS